MKSKVLLVRFEKEGKVLFSTFWKGKSDHKVLYMWSQSILSIFRKNDYVYIGEI